MSFFRRHSRKGLIAICAACTATVAGLYDASPPFRRIEISTQDQLMRLQLARRSPLRPELVYLAIDNASAQLDQFNPAEIAASPGLRIMKESWPWRRAIYPLVIERLMASGAIAVGFDVLFPNAKDGDASFRESLEKFRGRVVIGCNFVEKSESDSGIGTLTPPAVSLIPSMSPPDGRVGFVNFWRDAGDVVRRGFFGVTQEMIEGGFGWNPADPLIESLGARLLRKADRAPSIPQPGHPWRIRFAGPPGTFQPHSLCDLFDERKWERPPYNRGDFFRGKIVVVGPEGNWSKDEALTPWGLMFGSEIHLNAINAALNHDFLTETSERDNYGLIVLAGALAWLLCRLAPAPLLRVALLGALSFGWLAMALILYNRAGLFITTTAPLAALISSGVCCLAWDFFREQREKAHVRRTLERYVSKDAVREIIDNPRGFFDTLGGMRKPMAILFSDLRGFTSMTEMADSHALVRQLNDYFTEMVEPILRHQGALDKFIGDAVMAVWGNIRTRGAGTDVRAAVLTALEMRTRLAKLNEQWEQNGKPTFAIGIGITFGEAIVGNIGSLQQMNLTVIGDAVNLASRLEGVTKEYGLDLLLSAEAAAHAREFFHLQTVGLVQVKGRRQPVEIFTVLGERPKPLEAALAEYSHAFEDAMRHYRSRDFVGAEQLFQRCELVRKGDPLARIYRERCAALEASPPSTEWNGVFVMSEK